MIAMVVAAVRAEVIAEITEAVRAEVIVAIRAVVKAEVDECWAGWLARRDAALAEGRDFDEPRPDAVNHSVSRCSPSDPGAPVAWWLYIPIRRSRNSGILP